MARATLLALLLAGVLAAGAPAAPRTTEPSELTKVNVLVTDKGVRIARDQFTRGSLTRYPRGAIINFAILNRGTKPYRAELLPALRPKAATLTKPVKPGARVNLQFNFFFRGKFTLRTVLNGKQLASAPIVIY